MALVRFQVLSQRTWSTESTPWLFGTQLPTELYVFLLSSAWLGPQQPWLSCHPRSWLPAARCWWPSLSAARSWGTCGPTRTCNHHVHGHYSFSTSCSSNSVSRTQRRPFQPNSSCSSWNHRFFLLVQLIGINAWNYFLQQAEWWCGHVIFCSELQ